MFTQSSPLRRPLLACAALLLAASPLLADWPQFRPNVGLVPPEIAKNAPSTFDGPSSKNILWKTKIPLPGESSPIVVGKKIILTSATPEKRVVYALDADTGKILWETPVDAGGKPITDFEPMPDTGYAAPTPLSDGKHILVVFADGDYAALSLEGTILWKKNLGLPESAYGHASSPALYKNNAIIQFDTGNTVKEDGSYLLSLDIATGKENWKTPRPVPNSWSSPIIVPFNNAHQIITAGDPFAIAYDADTGKELWRAKCLGMDTAPTPAFANNLAFFTTVRKDLTAYAIDGKGDVTRSHRKWKSNDEEPPECPSPVANETFVFLPSDNGRLACLDTNTGHVHWSHDIEHELRSSPIIVGQELWILDRKGTLHRFALDKELKKLPTSSLGEPTDAQPAFAHNRLYIRGKTHLFAIGEK